jgi:RNA polymerase sigma-70 factor (ECF subfamily)
MDETTLSDEELVVRIGDAGHFEELYRRHVSKVTAFATRRCSTAHEVPDLVAAVWLEVIASAHSFDPRKGRALPWILGVAANLTASNQRRRLRESEALQRLGRRPTVDPEDIVELDEQIDAMAPARRAMETLQQLPLGERLVAELVLIEGLQPQEAAKALGIRPATARMRLMRARKKLQGSLAPFRVMTDRPLPISEA